MVDREDINIVTAHLIQALCIKLRNLTNFTVCTHLAFQYSIFYITRVKCCQRVKNDNRRFKYLYWLSILIKLRRKFIFALITEFILCPANVIDHFKDIFDGYMILIQNDTGIIFLSTRNLKNTFIHSSLLNITMNHQTIRIRRNDIKCNLIRQCSFTSTRIANEGSECTTHDAKNLLRFHHTFFIGMIIHESIGIIQRKKSRRICCKTISRFKETFLICFSQ